MKTRLEKSSDVTDGRRELSIASLYIHILKRLGAESMRELTSSVLQASNKSHQFVIKV